MYLLTFLPIVCHWGFLCGEKRLPHLFGLCYYAHMGGALRRLTQSHWRLWGNGGFWPLPYAWNIVDWKQLVGAWVWSFQGSLTGRVGGSSCLKLKSSMYFSYKQEGWPSLWIFSLYLSIFNHEDASSRLICSFLIVNALQTPWIVECLGNWGRVYNFSTVLLSTLFTGWLWPS